MLVFIHFVVSHRQSSAIDNICIKVSWNLYNFMKYNINCHVGLGHCGQAAILDRNRNQQNLNPTTPL